MNEQILKNIIRGDLILFFGAGASFGCKSANGNPIPMSGKLAEDIASTAGFTYENESLDAVYEAARERLGVRLNSFLEERFKHVIPSAEYETIAAYTWRRIYSLNIDDGLDKSLTKYSPQKINKLNSRDSIVDRDQFFEFLEYIKLNGTIDRIKDGLIFSPSEYAKATSSHLPWYSQCASDFVRTPILFIGTQLNEPLLKYHIERYQQLNSESPGTSYLLCPSATEIQIAGLKKYNIEYIKGTLNSFTSWLGINLPTPPKPKNVAIESIPQLATFLSSSAPIKYADLFANVTVIKRERLPASNPLAPQNTIRDFYKGFKPKWNDIVDNIPAELEILQSSIVRIKSLNNMQYRLLPFLGPAGSGKTTLLMQLCWKFSTESDWDVFFLDSEPTSLLSTLEAIEKTAQAKNILVAIDDLEFFTEDLQFVLKSGRLSKILLIGAEREGIWNRRGKHVLAGLHYSPIYVRDFTEIDAKKILTRLERYASWTRLGKMSEKERLRELLDKSKKQLLIALLETTLGRGFEKIIENEYALITDEDEKLFLVTIALATDRRVAAPLALVDRALDKMSILRRSVAFADDLAGIIHQYQGTLTARHPIYAKYLLDRVIDPTIATKAINGLLQAFSDYQPPVIQHIKKSEASLYKGLINHKFLFDVLKGNREKVIQTYTDLEKKFERDGLFWLQYGLALRDFSDHTGALEKLKIACTAYPMAHTQHALAQQYFLLSLQACDRTIALGLAEEAKEILEKLDDVIESDDTYPIITLAEGLTSVYRQHGTETEARGFAKRYTLILENRTKRYGSNSRLQSSYERMFKYASVGIWTE